MFDKVLVAVGRKPNGKVIGAEAAGVQVDERGFIPVDKQQRTNVGHVFAIGDVVGQPMLAHKATHEGKVAAEVTAGHNSYFDATVIPSVAYTDPEVAWVGVTENEAKAAGIKYGKGDFPWAASGRSLSLGRDEGMTKVIFDETTDRIIGCGIVGPNAGDLIAEAALAIELGADAADIGADHPPAPHPLRNRGDGRRSLRGHHHRPLHAQEEGVEMTADAAAAEPVTSNDTTSNDLAGEHVTGDETPREQRTGSGKDIMSEGPYELIRSADGYTARISRAWPCRAGLPDHQPRHRVHPGASAASSG